MADFSSYVRLDNDRSKVVIRQSVADKWDEHRTHAWSFDEAADLAKYIEKIVEEARRSSPEVQELAEELSDLDAELSDSWEDMALALIRKGYRKQ